MSVGTFKDCRDPAVLIAATNELARALGGVQLALVQRQSVRRACFPESMILPWGSIRYPFEPTSLKKSPAIIRAHRPFRKNETFLDQFRLLAGRDNARNPSRFLRRQRERERG